MAPLAMAAIPAVLGAVGSYKSAKDAKNAASKPQVSERTPYGPATSHIQDILDAARRQYQSGQQGPMPYAWQNFMNNPTSPGLGTDPTYGGSNTPSAGGGSNLNWRGRDRSEVQAAKAARQDARTEARQKPQEPPSSSGMAQMDQGQPGAPGGFQAQSGPFGYSQGLRDYMMQQYQGGGVGGYQPAMQYIQGLLGGQSQNPYLSQSFQRVSNYQNPYFSSFLPK